MGQLLDQVTVARLFEQFGPVVDQRQAVKAGVARGVLRRAEARGLVRRVAKAAFVLEAGYADLDVWQQFRLRAIGFQMCAREATHLTGWAAALMHELPTFGRPSHRSRCARAMPTPRPTRRSTAGCEPVTCRLSIERNDQGLRW